MGSLNTLEEIMDIGEKLCMGYSERIEEMKEGTSIEAFKENLESIRKIQRQRELALRENVRRLTMTLSRLEDETRSLKDENGASLDKAISRIVESKDHAFKELEAQMIRRKEIHSSWVHEGGGEGDDDDDPIFELEATLNNLEIVTFPLLYKKLEFLVTVSKIVFRDETLNGTGMQISGCK